MLVCGISRGLLPGSAVHPEEQSQGQGRLSGLKLFQPASQQHFASRLAQWEAEDEPEPWHTTMRRGALNPGLGSASTMIGYHSSNVGRSFDSTQSFSSP